MEASTDWVIKAALELLWVAIQDPVTFVFLAGMALYLVLSLWSIELRCKNGLHQIDVIQSELLNVMDEPADEVRLALFDGAVHKAFAALGIRLAALEIEVNSLTERSSNKISICANTMMRVLEPKKIFDLILPIGLQKRPNLFLTLGVVGTFLGLTIGVSGAGAGLASPDISVARQAMSDLLDGAKLAFLTSLFGLVGSMILNSRIRSCRERIIAHAENTLVQIFRTGQVRSYTARLVSHASNTMNQLAGSAKTWEEINEEIKGLNQRLNQSAKAFQRQMQSIESPIVEANKAVHAIATRQMHIEELLKRESERRDG